MCALPTGLATSKCLDKLSRKKEGSNLFAKYFHVKIIRLFTPHGKFHKIIHAREKKQTNKTKKKAIQVSCKIERKVC